MSKIRKEIKIIKKEIISVLIVTFMFAMIFGVVKIGMAANEANVSCTVTGELIALTVTDGTIAYGTIAMSGDKNTIDTGNTQVVNNTGTVTEDFFINPLIRNQQKNLGDAISEFKLYFRIL